VVCDWNESAEVLYCLLTSDWILFWFLVF